jgi:hypothetical protein
MHERESPVWNCRESGRARAQLDALAEDPEFDKLWQGVRWLIIRNPTIAGQLVPGKQQTYSLKTADFMAIGMTVKVVTYSIIDPTERICEIVSILDP